MNKTVFLIFLVSFFFSGCVTVQSSQRGAHGNNQRDQNNEYGLRQIPRQAAYRYNAFVRADVARSIMAEGHFFGVEEVSNTFRRTMPEKVFILPYLESTLYTYANKSNCFLALVTDFANANNPRGANPASVKGLIRVARFKRYLRRSLLFLPDKKAGFLYSHPRLGWQLTCFEPLHKDKQLRRIVPPGKRVMSAHEIAQLMLLDENILRGKNVVSSDRTDKDNYVIVSKTRKGKIFVSSRNFSMANDVLALGVKKDR